MVWVLIDTWWNVNNTDIYPVGSYACFNRYMVECEFCDIPAVDGCRTGFNRYMVECEYRIVFFTHQSVLRFNRYMVECE